RGRDAHRQHPAARPGDPPPDVHAAAAGARLLQLRREAGRGPLPAAGRHAHRLRGGAAADRLRGRPHRPAAAVAEPAQLLQPRLRDRGRAGHGRPFFASGFLGTDADEQTEEIVGGVRCQASQGVPELTPEQPRVYYGDQMTDYVVVGGRDEFDRPLANGEDTYRYTGQGGVEVGSFFRKLLFAIKFREANFVLSEVVNPDSKVLFHRVPRERVEKVAPFLTVDGDPYPAVVDGRIKWIVDAYTTSNSFPYSQRIDLQQETRDAQVGVGVAQLQREEINYIRNSVKATVDAYDGTVTLYEFVEDDPVL